MADAAWSPDDSTFRSPYCPMRGRVNGSPASKAFTRFPGVRSMDFERSLPVSPP